MECHDKTINLLKELSPEKAKLYDYSENRPPLDDSNLKLLREAALQGVELIRDRRDIEVAIQSLRQQNTPQVGPLQHCRICGGLGNITTCPYNKDSVNPKPHLHLFQIFATHFRY